METQLREIEKKIDNYHRRLKIFEYNRDIVVLHLLRVYEDTIRLGGLFVMNQPQINNVYINCNADSLDMAMRWAYECCQDNTACNNYDCNQDLYLMIALDVFTDAIKYRAICDAYSLWSRNRQTAKISEDGLNVTFDYVKNTKGEIEAYDFIRGNDKKNSFMNDSKMDEFINKIPELKEMISSNVTVDCNDNVCYEITQDIWENVYKLTQYILEDISELPEEWKFKSFSLKEYKEFWMALLTLSFIHSLSCMSSTAKGGGLNSCVIIKTYEELEKIFLSRTNLSKERIRIIIDLITYNPNLKNGDILWQPLIKLSTLEYAISPSLIMTSSYERNIISLINKVDQKSYSKISSTKEEIMTCEMREKLKEYTNLKLAFHRPLPDPLPDMDIVLYDTITKTLITGELKWLIATDSIQEVCARDEDIKKGIEQVKLIKEYISNDLPDTLNRAFENRNYEVESAFSCVITRNNVGTSENGENIPIINEDSFFSLLEKHKGNLKQVVIDIKQKEYYPVLNNDYKVVKNDIKYAGYTFKVDSIEMVNKVIQGSGNYPWGFDEVTTWNKKNNNLGVNKSKSKRLRKIKKESKKKNRKK
ncbi:hypothetical protein [Clostridium beijerinckii]|uniref:hypothetical protein n=1 Tax=Clostridium beijerinckii TaxID=1520 RepID=UPI0003D2E75B|nr:hypothetical protein [Clostridium beijerinckii]ALB48005.1 hypothetical protein X276_23400 [Clostridium beijerinckii NRRL B-598]